MTNVLAFRAVAWYGGRGGRHRFTAVPPVGFDRYQVSGSLRVTASEPLPQIVLVVIRDKETGAEVSIRDGTATLSVTTVLAPDAVKRLWSDARRLAELASRMGPAPGQGLTVPKLVQTAIAYRGPDGTWPTEQTTADELGLSLRNVSRVASTVGGWPGVLAIAAETVSR